jgi:hypothetical protein
MSTYASGEGRLQSKVVTVDERDRRLESPPGSRYRSRSPPRRTSDRYDGRELALPPNGRSYGLTQVIKDAREGAERWGAGSPDRREQYNRQGGREEKRSTGRFAPPCGHP